MASKINGIVTERQVRGIKLPEDAVPTNHWMPLPHKEVLDAVGEVMDQTGLKIAKREDGKEDRLYTLGRDGAQMFATLPLESEIMPGVNMMLGIANSFDKSLALRIGFGSRVFICSNGCFFAEQVLRMKHCPGSFGEDLANLKNEAKRVLNMVESYREQQEKFFTRLCEVEIDSATMNDLAVRAAQRGAITKGQILDAVEEFHEPQYEEFSQPTAYAAHNAFTEISKKAQRQNGNSHSQRMVALTGLFTQQFGSDLDLNTVLN